MRPSRAREPGSGLTTSDVSRARPWLISAIAAAAAVLIAALAAPAGSLAAPGPVGRPHRLANVPCAGCHGERADGPASSDGCVGCHGEHASTRAAHRALAAREAFDKGGAPILGCTSCHAGHAGSEGITFIDPGGAVRWKGGAEQRTFASGPAGATVALVPLGACAPCHDLARRDDPVRACMSPASDVDLCFDEHAVAGRGGGRACALQHGAARFVAWDAARASLARSTSPVAAIAGAPWLFLGSGFGAGTLAFVAATVMQRRRMAAPRPGNAPAVRPARMRLPQIDAARCLGCHACAEACPFDVLSIDKHIAVVARPDACCGVGACESACPNGSLRLAEAGAPRPGRPRVDDHLESLDRPGLFVAGDLTGVPLIRNAIAQGARAVDRIATTFPRAERSPGMGGSLDLVVIGAGPAGLSAALRARELGLSCAVLEQSSLAATIRAFPRGKVVHDAPLELPLEGALWMRESTKEELLGHWTRIVRSHRLAVHERHKATAIGGASGRFVVRAETPEGTRELHAARVLLAVGSRGTPRRLDAEITPAARARVLLALSDARAYAGRRVLVVGLGDSAMEAAIALARQPGTVVTVSYRGGGFARGRTRNVDEMRRLEASGRVRIMFESRVTRVDEEAVLLSVGQTTTRLAVDFVLALLGGEPARALLEAAGVGLEASASLG
jgi:thioredoxin reductase/NAD-dependent dihydropyrimidine dehydrogenase PreA subunit